MSIYDIQIRKKILKSTSHLESICTPKKQIIKKVHFHERDLIKNLLHTNNQTIKVPIWIFLLHVKLFI